MPELPEVETIVRGLEPRLRGARIVSFRILDPSLLRGPAVPGLAALEGKRIQKVRRRGKMVLIECQEELSLVFHLKMTGQLLLMPPQTAVDKHTRCVIRLEDPKAELRFRDIRKFGFMRCSGPGPSFPVPEFANLGPEPLHIDWISFRALFRGRSGRIKSLLLNQAFLAGIGNIYADEILYEAGIHPLTSARNFGQGKTKALWNAMRSVLNAAISRKGTSIRNYTDSEGRPGEFHSFLQVYDRGGEPCRRCRNPIRKIRLGGRSAHFCPSCQKIRKIRKVRSFPA